MILNKIKILMRLPWAIYTLFKNFSYFCSFIFINQKFNFLWQQESDYKDMEKKADLFIM
jgi:hypothetical protein